LFTDTPVLVRRVAGLTSQTISPWLGVTVVRVRTRRTGRAFLAGDDAVAH
jgi:hypothetical protein